MDVQSYRCRRTETPIVVDGELRDIAWQKAGRMSFRCTLDGSPPEFPTTARMLWDDDYLYISYHCVGKDMWATMARRDDRLWEEEVVEIFLDADRDRIGYVEIEVSPFAHFRSTFPNCHSPTISAIKQIDHYL